MSHDRGCPCGKEGREEYLTCKRGYCFRLSAEERKYSNHVDTVKQGEKQDRKTA